MPTSREQYDKKSKAEMFSILTREILAARLKVTLDRELNRPTSETVRKLAAMNLPPIDRTWEEGTPQRQHCDCCSREL